MKGIEIEPEVELQIDLNVTSYIPDEYIENANQKIEIYQNIALCQNEENIQNIIDEIIDRFGDMPTEVENQLKINKIANKNIGKKTAVVFTFEPNQFQLDITQIVKKYGNKIKFSAGIKPMITLEIGTDNERQILNDVTEFLRM